MRGFFMKRIIKLCNFILLIICVIISSLLFINKQYSLNTLKNVFNNLFSFAYIGYDNMTTSSSQNFIKLEQDKYYNDSYSIYTPMKGSVIKVGKDYIDIKCENGLICHFSNIININVKVLDVINKDYKLANFIDYFIFYFIDDGKILSYEQVMENY
jgi:hypothetical protein